MQTVFVYVYRSYNYIPQNKILIYIFISKYHILK